MGNRLLFVWFFDVTPGDVTGKKLAVLILVAVTARDITGRVISAGWKVSSNYVTTSLLLSTNVKRSNGLMLSTFGSNMEAFRLCISETNIRGCQAGSVFCLQNLKVYIP